MRVVLSWLREFAPTELGAEELAELLTSRGAEVERIDRPWDGLEGLIAARVLEVRDHPNSDRLCIARVQTGSGELEVVVGVRNMAPGDLVPLAPPGARVPILPEPLSAREIRGVVSNGMLCAPDELGISAAHDGIVILPGPVEPGTDLKRELGLADAVLEIEVTPNRPDFLSVVGIAREVVAATGVPLLLPDASVEELDEKAEGAATIRIDDTERCPRYLARIIGDVRHVPAPLAVQARLTASGMRPISAAVDATNYAMLEVGQPLHPFDLARLAGPGIIVRRAAQGERLVTLDGVERAFTTDDLLIADLERAVAVAGVIGGATSEVSPSTGTILLESATFERGGVQRTRRRLDLSTEASIRFERGTDPEAPPVGADRACHLMQRWFGATVLAGQIDVGAAPPRRRIVVRPERAAMLIGYPVSADDVEAVAGRLGLSSDRLDGVVEVEIPGYRVDLEREVDVIEDIARVQGYDRVGSTLPAVRQAGGTPPDYAFRERVRERLTAAGLREIRPVPFASQADIHLVPGVTPVRVSNPLDADAAFLRTSLVPGLLDALRRNVHRHVGGAALYEVGVVFGLDGGDPRELGRVGFAMTGPAELGWSEPPRAFDVFDAKGVLEAIVHGLNVRAWSLGQAADAPFHPGRSATVLLDGRPAGIVGELHPAVIARYDLTDRVAAAELDLEGLRAASSTDLEVREPTRFPPVRRDLAFVVDRSVAAGAVLAEIERSSGDLLGSITLFDVFQGPPLDAGRKSLAFALELRAPGRSLTGEEADAVVARVAAAVASAFGGELRAG
ncbi:MAG TPA: phenylalanine--tRNA ligase subunit beta [Actinomycetota bacterium]